MTVYYHGGPAGLRPGARLLPASATGARWIDEPLVADLDTDRARKLRDREMRFVHFTPDRELAYAYAASYAAERGPAGCVYKVRPLGGVRRHPVEDTYTYMAPSAVVVAVVEHVTLNALEAATMRSLKAAEMRTMARRLARRDRATG